MAKAISTPQGALLFINKDTNNLGQWKDKRLMSAMKGYKFMRQIVRGKNLWDAVSKAIGPPHTGDVLTDSQKEHNKAHATEIRNFQAGESIVFEEMLSHIDTRTLDSLATQDVTKPPTTLGGSPIVITFEQIRESGDVVGLLAFLKAVAEDCEGAVTTALMLQLQSLRNFRQSDNLTLEEFLLLWKKEREKTEQITGDKMSCQMSIAEFSLVVRAKFGKEIADVIKDSEKEKTIKSMPIDTFVAKVSLLYAYNRRTEALQASSEFAEKQIKNAAGGGGPVGAVNAVSTLNAAPTTAKKAKETCFQWAKGSCRFGEKCRFAHDRGTVSETSAKRQKERNKGNAGSVKAGKKAMPEIAKGLEAPATK